MVLSQWFPPWHPADSPSEPSRGTAGLRGQHLSPRRLPWLGKDRERTGKRLLTAAFVWLTGDLNAPLIP